MTDIQTSPLTRSTSSNQIAEIPRTDVFISYSRKDKAFVEILYSAFKQLDRNPWVDWDDIRKGEEWWEAIKRGIEAADTFVFVISPDSIASSVCRDEVEHAAQHNKRFLPIVRREGFDTQRVHPSISSHNWLFFRETDDFDSAFAELVKATDTDLAHVQAHTRLLVRAIEWQHKNRHSSYLLRGQDLQESNQWLLQGANKEPQPTELQIAYIHASQEAETASLKARQKATWVVILTTILVNMLLAIAVGSWYFRFETHRTIQQVENNLVNSLKVGLVGIDGDEFETLAALTPAEAIDRNPLYQEHQEWLANVNAVFPRATLRTYIPGDASNQAVWIGDVSRELGTPKTQFRELFVAQNLENQIFDGVTESTVIMTPYTDELGSWVSATGAIKDSTGQTVGGLKVYFREDYVREVQRTTQRNLTIAYFAIFAWLSLLSLIILRVTRPYEKRFEQRL